MGIWGKIFGEVEKPKEASRPHPSLIVQAVLVAAGVPEEDINDFWFESGIMEKDWFVSLGDIRELYREWSVTPQ